MDGQNEGDGECHSPTKNLCCDEKEQTSEKMDIHSKGDRRYRRDLVSFSDLLDDDDLTMTSSVLMTNISVSAWGDISPNPKYIAPSVRKKKVELNAAENEEDDSLTSSRSSLPTARNYEIDFVNCPAWKIGVEPVTYRYIPNNGRYRAFKLARRLDTPKAFKKSYSTSKLSSNQQHLHREIQRELRKEFELFISLERQKSSIERQRAAKLKYHKEKHVSKSEDEYPHSFSPHPEAELKRFAQKRMESQSGNISKPPNNLPPMDLQHLSKEQGEYYLEQVSSRLKDLERDMQSKRVTLTKTHSEGYLSASAVAKQSRPDIASLVSPRDASRSRVKNIDPYKIHKKLPTIMDQKILVDESLANPLRGVNFKFNQQKSNALASELKINKTHRPLSADRVNPPLLGVDDQSKNTDSSQIPTVDNTPLNGDFLMFGNKKSDKIYEIIPSESPAPSINRKPTHTKSQSKPDANSGYGSMFSVADSLDLVAEGNAALQNGYDTSHSSYRQREDDDVSLGARSVTSQVKNTSAEMYMQYVDPRGQNPTPQYEDYAKSQTMRNDSGKMQREIKKLHERIVAGEKAKEKGQKNYISERKKVGLNPYFPRPRAPQFETHGINIATTGVDNSQGDSRTLGRVPFAEPLQPKVTAHASVSGNFMPEVMVRRAEIALTSKRII